MSLITSTLILLGCTIVHQQGPRSPVPEVRSHHPTFGWELAARQSVGGLRNPHQDSPLEAPYRRVFPRSLPVLRKSGCARATIVFAGLGRQPPTSCRLGSSCNALDVPIGDCGAIRNVARSGSPLAAQERPAERPHRVARISKIKRRTNKSGRREVVVRIERVMGRKHGFLSRSARRGKNGSRRCTRLRDRS